MIQIPNPLPPDGFSFPIAHSSTTFKGFPWIGIARGGTNTKLILFADFMGFNVVRKQEKSYVQIESVEIELDRLALGQRGYSQNVLISFKGTIFAYRANIREKEDLITLLRFFQRQHVPLSDAALALI